MEGSAAPLGAERRRLAPLTGPTVWGSATPRRSPPSARSTGSSQTRRLHTASVPRRLRGLSLSPVFRPRGPAPTPSQNTCAARATRTGSRRQSGAPPPTPRTEAAAQVEAAARAAGRARSLGSRPGWGWPGTCRPPAGRAGLRAGRASQAQVSEGLRSALPPPPLPSLLPPPPLGKSPK